MSRYSLKDKLKYSLRNTSSNILSTTSTLTPTLTSTPTPTPVPTSTHTPKLSTGSPLTPLSKRIQSLSAKASNGSKTTSASLASKSLFGGSQPPRNIIPSVNIKTPSIPSSVASTPTSKYKPLDKQSLTIPPPDPKPTKVTIDRFASIRQPQPTQLQIPKLDGEFTSSKDILVKDVLKKPEPKNNPPGPSMIEVPRAQWQLLVPGEFIMYKGKDGRWRQGGTIAKVFPTYMMIFMQNGYGKSNTHYSVRFENIESIFKTIAVEAKALLGEVDKLKAELESLKKHLRK